MIVNILLKVNIFTIEHFSYVCITLEGRGKESKVSIGDTNQVMVDIYTIFSFFVCVFVSPILRYIKG